MESISYLDITGVVCSLLLLSVLAIILNTLCIYIIQKSARLNSKPSSILIINLLSVHLLQGIFVFPLYVGKKLGNKIPSFLLSKLFANGYRFTYIVSFYGACLGILSIALDRFLATYLLNLYKAKVNARRITIYLICLWIYIFALCVIPFFNFQEVTGNININSTNETTTRESTFYYYNHQPEWVVFMLIFNAAVPYILIIASYVYIVLRLRKIESFKIKSTHAIQIPKSNNRLIHMKQESLSRYKEVAYLTLGLSFTYGVCWTPSIINYVLMTTCKSCYPNDYENSKTEQITGYSIKYLAYVNSVASPLLYCFHHSEFRKVLSRIKSSVLRRPLPKPEQIEQDTSFMIND